jgi:hypothetical protein
MDTSFGIGDLPRKIFPLRGQFCSERLASSPKASTDSLSPQGGHDFGLR